MDLLSSLVTEWQSRPVPECITRDLSIRLKGKLAIAIIGMRRSGKTWRLFQEMQKLIKDGVNPAHILYFNFDDNRLAQYHGENLLDDLLESFFRLNPDARREQAYFFFDEIQEIPNWARFTRRIIDTENIKLYLSGSSAKLLSSEIATEFRGRSLAFELLPFSFREYLRFCGIDEKPSILNRSEYEHRFNDYLTEGGFPDAILQDSAIRIALLQSYLAMVVLRDVLERYELSNARGVKELAEALVASNANLVSIKRLSDQLAARNITMSREKVSEVCAHLQDAFLVFFVPMYSSSLQKTRVNPKKVYASDPGLAFALSAAPTLNVGQRFEQTVYLELRRRYPLLRDSGISYYLTADRKEVDFILGDPAQQLPKKLFQVCLSLAEPKTREREVGALVKAMQELSLKNATIITLYENDRITTDAGIIEVLPAWNWFLDKTDNESLS